MRALLTARDFVNVMGAAYAEVATANEVIAMLEESGVKVGKVRPHYQAYAIRRRNLPKFASLLRRRNEIFATGNALPSMLLPTVVAHFDAFFSRLLATNFRVRPELTKSIEKQLTVQELMQFSSIDAAKDHYIEKEIDNVMYKSRTEQLAWLSGKLKVDFGIEKKLKDNFFELTERRNIIIHNGSLVNLRYLDNLRRLGIDPGKKSVGKRISTTRKYLFSSVVSTLEMGFIISQLVWRKLAPAEAEDADELANEVTFELIEMKEYEAAKALLEFCRSDKIEFASERCKLVNVINYANVLRLEDKKEEAKAVLDQHDWTARSLDFEMCASAVLEDADRCAELLLKHKDIEGIGPPEYAHWPVFSSVRETDKFREAFKSVYGMDLLDPPKEEEMIAPSNSTT